MAIPYKGDTVIIQGLVPALPDQLVVHVSSLIESSPQSDSGVPAALTAVLDDFVAIFEAPSTLPPERDCDHSIPSLPGARPVHIQPYRYPPSLERRD